MTRFKETVQQHRSNAQHSSSPPVSATLQTTSAASTPGPLGVQAAVMDSQHASAAHLLEVQRRYGNRAVQRMLSGSARATEPHFHKQDLPSVSRASLPGSLQGGLLDSQSQTQIERARGSGSPLDASVSAQVGSALGADFSGVKVHTDRKADELNRSLSAKAFTTGGDIFFSKGAYQPGSSSGKHLLAHELTHVVQQSRSGYSAGSRTPPGGSRPGSAKLDSVQTKRGIAMPVGVRRAAKPNRMQFKMTVGAAHDRYEQEAERVAAQVVQAPAPFVSVAQRAIEKDGLQPMPLTQRASVEIGLLGLSTVQRDLDKPENYKNPNYDGKTNTKEYTSVAGKGIGKFHNTTSKEEFAKVEKIRAEEKAKGKNVVHQNSTDLGFLYAQAEMLRDTYNAKCQELADKTRGTLSKRPGDGLKGIDRTLEKMAADYGGDASRMADLTGASIAFDNPDDLIACYKLIASDNLFKITKLKNSLANAYSYGDINMVVAMGEARGPVSIPIQREVNGKMVTEIVEAPFKGFQIELQLHLQPILTQKQAGHKQYEEQRAIEAKPIYEKTKTPKFLDTPNLLADDKKRWQELQAEMVAIYGVGWKKIINQSTPISLGLLFFKQLITKNTRAQRRAQEEAFREEYFKKKMREAIPPTG